MRRIFSLVVAFVFVLAGASAVFAQFVSVSTQTKTAKVSFTGAGTFTWDIAVKNVSDDTDATDITWDAASITIGTTGWANAEQYVLITSTLTATNAGLQVYTDNKNGTAYKYTGTATENLGGLVGNIDQTANPLPMAWSAVTAKNTTTVNPEAFVGLYFKDRGNTNVTPPGTPFQDGEEYITVLNARGLKYGGDVNERGGSPSGTFYMYIGADFSAAMTPNEYGTDTLTFEQYTE